VFHRKRIRMFGRQIDILGREMGRHWGRNFDEAQLRNLVRTMTPRSRFFQVLREELKRQGRWKYLPRGKPGERLKPVGRSKNPAFGVAVSDSAASATERGKSVSENT
jgi:hypothetical protein